MGLLKGPTHATFFDLDHTLLKVNSSASFGRFLYSRGVFSTCRYVQLGFAYLLHKSGFLPLSEMQRYIFRKLFQNGSSHLFTQLVEDFLDQNLNQLLYLPVVERLKEAQRKGYLVAILSSSPDFLVKRIGERLGVACVESSIYAVDAAGEFSHIEKLLQGRDKAEWVTQTINKFALVPENITVYSDSILDLPFLESGGTKVVVKPDRKLRNISHQNNWEIL